MFSLLSTIARGRAHEAADSVAARNATTILGQQIREAAAALDQAGRAVAVAEAGLRRDEEALRQLDLRIADLEERVVAALTAGLDDLARQGAQEIADLEIERDQCRQGVSRVREEIARRRPSLRASRSRLRRLSRGRDLIMVRMQVQQLAGGAGETRLARISDAEATLARIEDAQAVEDAVAAERCGSDAVADRLAEAGCGPARWDGVERVLDRLRGRIRQTPAD